MLILAGLALFWLYLTERVKNIARGETEKALASLNAVNQRRIQEFSLYATKRHEVYPKRYKRYRTASDRFASNIGLSMGPDFKQWSRPELLEYFDRHKLPERTFAPILAAYDRSLREGGEEMSKLNHRIQLHRANLAFEKAKALEFGHEVYLSDAVRDQVQNVRSLMAATAVRADPDDRAEKLIETRNAMTGAVARLLLAIREELRRGEADLAPYAAPGAPTSP